MKFEDRLREVRNAAIEIMKIQQPEEFEIEGAKMTSKLCATVEDLHYAFIFKNSVYWLVQVNPSASIYAYNDKLETIYHIPVKFLPTEVICDIADLLTNENSMFDFEKYSKGVCYTSLFKDKDITEIKIV